MSSQPRTPTKRFLFLTQHLDLPRASGVDDAQWEHFQVAHLCNDSKYDIVAKSRQVAWSWTVAAESVAEAVLEGQSSFFVSINLNEASEKKRYCISVLENIHNYRLPKVIGDNSLKIEFDNGARIISLPSRPPRGLARFNGYWDEACHTRNDNEIYAGAMPVFTKGGRFRIGSSLMGATGMHWEIYEQKLRRYPDFTRASIPWWKVKAFCNDVRAAYQLAPNMPTAERVERFGNERIRFVFNNMHSEDFQREYECVYVDETSAWFPWEEIQAIQQPSLYTITADTRGEAVSKAMNAIAELKAAVTRGVVETAMAVGIDVGRTRNATEIFVVGCTTTDTYPLRLTLTLENASFDTQLAVAAAVFDTLPVKKGYIDQNGIGRNLAERLEKRFPSKVEGVDFTVQSKTVWATDAKMLAQQLKAIIPANRDLAYQIHSIKRTITGAKNMVFDTDRTEKHHADKFWAWALALSAARVKVMVPRVF